MATPENDALHKLTEAERASHPAGNLHLAATRIQALVRGKAVCGYSRAKKGDLSAHLPGFATPSPAKAAVTTASVDSPDSVNAHPACRSHDPTTVADKSDMRLQALARGIKCSSRVQQHAISEHIG
jgi:hypothetical protein